MKPYYDDELKTLCARLGIPEGLGATGEYPAGKVRANDQGELKAAIAADPKTRMVFIDFGKPVAWLSIPPEGAIQLAGMLIAKARTLMGSDPRAGGPAGSN